MKASPAGKAAAPHRSAALAATGNGHLLAGALRRRPSLVTGTWLGSFLLLAAVLLIRNAYLFTTRIYEAQDFGANSIAVLQAKRFTLLTGNYSKEGFYHPGPALLYIQAAGESFVHDLLHLVPTPWNGQLIAILLLNAALVAACLAVFARYLGSVGPVLAVLAVVLGLAIAHPLALNSGWMPYVYFAPTLLLIVSGASVGTGQTRDLPLLALSAGLCINGQAEFLLFAPVTVLAAIGGLAVAHRRDLRGVLRGRRRDWVIALSVTGLLALPIVLYTVVHFPGEFGSYFAYLRRAAAHRAPHLSVVSTLTYTLRFWWPGVPVTGAYLGGAFVAAGLTVAALVLALACPRPGMRRFLLWALAMSSLTSVMFLYYAHRAVTGGSIKQAYVGYFYWAAPLTLALVVAGAAWAYLRDHRTAVVGIAAVVAVAVTAATLVPQHRDNPHDPPATYLGVPQIPRTVHELAALARGRPIVMRVAPNVWMNSVGVVVYADRIGVRACVAPTRPEWVILFRAQSICTRSEKRTGAPFWFTPRGSPIPQYRTVVTDLSGTVISR